MTSAADFIPPYAVTTWVDFVHVWVMVPNKNPALPPLILKYPLTEGGMTKALDFCKSRHAAMTPQGGHSPYVPPPSMSLTGHVAVATKKGQEKYKPEQRAAAAALLKRLGLGVK